MRFRFFVFVICVLGCGENGSPTTPPPPHPSYESVCRCNSRAFPLAVVRVESTPTAFRDERYSIERSGVEYDIHVERVLAATQDTIMAPGVSAHVRARQYLTHSGGQLLLAGTQADHPQYTRVEQGQRLLAYLSGPDPDAANRWSLSPLATAPSSDALPRRLFSFPTGTPMSQVLDPAEWTCTPATPIRGDCPLPDAGSGADAAPD